MADNWRIAGSIIYRRDGPRDPKILPLTIQSEIIIIEFRFLTKPPPSYYKAGWINQASMLRGKLHFRPGFMVPILPSFYKLETDRPYRLRFSPVLYLFPCVVTVYYSL